MIRLIDIKELSKLRKSLPLIDVRSPAEFRNGHIPDAFNIPLFNNEERKAVGIAYQQQGRNAAVLKGLDLVGIKLSGFVKQAQKIAPDQELLMHCWRGGMRSESMAWLLSLAGFKIHILQGGYKAYRRFIGQAWQVPSKIIILSGKTGSGKTEILQFLAKSGHQVLDLEHYAHHKGSAFGALGQEPQPTSEQFENDIAEIWQELDLNQPVWIEDESRNIGRIIIPEKLFLAMSKARVISLDMPKPLRIQRLIQDYANYPKNLLTDSIEKITRRLGGQNMKSAVSAVQENDFATAIDLVLNYYDKAYYYDLIKKEEGKVYQLSVESADAEVNANKILNFCQTNRLI